MADTLEARLLVDLTHFWRVEKKMRNVPKLSRIIGKQSISMSSFVHRIVIIGEKAKEWATFDNNFKYWNEVAGSLELANAIRCSKNLKTWGNAKNLHLAEFLVAHHGWDTSEELDGIGSFTPPPTSAQGSVPQRDNLGDARDASPPPITSLPSPRRSPRTACRESPKSTESKALKGPCVDCKELIYLRASFCPKCKTNVREIRVAKAAMEGVARKKRWEKTGTFKSISRQIIAAAKHFSTRFPEDAAIVVFVAKKKGVGMKHDRVECFLATDHARVRRHLDESTFFHRMCNYLKVKCHTHCVGCKLEKVKLKKLQLQQEKASV